MLTQVVNGLRYLVPSRIVPYMRVPTFHRAIDVNTRALAEAGVDVKHAREFSQPGPWPASRQESFWEILATRAARLGHALPARVMGGNQFMRVLPASAVFMPEFGAWMTEMQKMTEVVRWTLYSIVSYATGGSLNTAFFGQSAAAATLGFSDTNMLAAGQLPGNQMQLVTSLRFKPIAPFADVQVTNTTPALAAGETYRLLTNTCRLELTISQKPYQIGAPVDLYPAGTGVGTFHTASAVAATTANFSHANNGHPSLEAVYRQDPPLGILPTRPFQVSYLATTLNTVTTAYRLCVYLDGLLFRAVQ